MTTKPLGAGILSTVATMPKEDKGAVAQPEVFYKGQRVQIWSADQEVIRGERTIADIQGVSLVLEGGYPEGTVPGDLISPAPLPPVRVHQMNWSTGEFQGLKRS